MPKFADAIEMETHSQGSTFAFSAAKIEHLGATEYTLGTVVVDVSGSVHPFAAQIEAALKETVRACRRNPRADNMMLRVVLFDDQVREMHGFKPLPDCNDADYAGCIQPGGSTALYDATYTAVKAATEYGKQLAANQYTANAALFVITDGQDNASKTSRQMVARELQAAKTSEALESIMPVLIGVGYGAGGSAGATGLDHYLQMFKDEAGFQQYVSVDAANDKALAKLGGFISQSLSSQSQSLGSGGASQSIVF